MVAHFFLFSFFFFISYSFLFPTLVSAAKQRWCRWVTRLPLCLCSLPHTTAELSVILRQSDCPEQDESFFLYIKHFTPEVAIAGKIAAWFNDFSDCGCFCALNSSLTSSCFPLVLDNCLASTLHGFTPNKCNCFVSAQLPHKLTVFCGLFCWVVCVFFFHLELKFR